MIFILQTGDGLHLAHALRHVFDQIRIGFGLNLFGGQRPHFNLQHFGYGVPAFAGRTVTRGTLLREQLFSGRGISRCSVPSARWSRPTPANRPTRPGPTASGAARS